MVYYLEWRATVGLFNFYLAKKNTEAKHNWYMYNFFAMFKYFYTEYKIDEG